MVIDNPRESMPLWLNEGLAEYDSTFHVDEGGRRAVVGRTPVTPTALELERRHLSIAELLAVETSSASYNEGVSVSRSSTPSPGPSCTCSCPARRIARLCWRRTAAWVADGTPSLDAWQQVFADQKNLARARTLRKPGGHERHRVSL